MNRLGFSILFFCIGFLAQNSNAGIRKDPPRQFIQIRVYHVADAQQIVSTLHFLQTSFIPAVHRHGVKNVGVFHAIANDTAVDKYVYVIIPFNTLNDSVNLDLQLASDKDYQQAGSSFLGASYDKPMFSRYETILLRAFEKMPVVKASGLTGPKKDRVYELRSYESPTDNLHHNKVQMFNSGDEVGIFNRLGFNAVFYGDVLFGSKMPNLMYMTSFENRQSREDHWKAFGNDPAWKQLSAMPEYQHNVSKAEITFLTPEEFSEL